MHDPAILRQATPARECEGKRDPRARVIAAALWIVLWLAATTVVLMTWHPWVIGAQTGCATGQRTGWDGRCRPG